MTTEYREIPGLRRGFTERERGALQRKPEPSLWDMMWEKYEWQIVFCSFVFCLAALVFFLTTVFGLTTVHAAELSYKDVHTEAQACAYLHAHPGSITNVKWCNI